MTTSRLSTVYLATFVAETLGSTASKQFELLPCCSWRSTRHDYECHPLTKAGRDSTIRALLGNPEVFGNPVLAPVVSFELIGQPVDSTDSILVVIATNQGLSDLVTVAIAARECISDAGIRSSGFGIHLKDAREVWGGAVKRFKNDHLVSAPEVATNLALLYLALGTGRSLTAPSPGIGVPDTSSFRKAKGVTDLKDRNPSGFKSVGDTRPIHDRWGWRVRVSCSSPGFR